MTRPNPATTTWAGCWKRKVKGRRTLTTAPCGGSRHRGTRARPTAGSGSGSGSGPGRGSDAGSGNGHPW
ncbi:hypothetical protein GCM10009733_102390 [Nonomuraea maheshkhaliensis]|uniref:Uncharacterized protein n=1 Tax=Nonomuraea maheshkhaliensis TaxID=419590 RepID=A0ABP4TK84_9ACTN